MSIKKTLVVSILLFSLVDIKAAETQNIAALVASLSPDLPELSPDSYAFLQEERKILTIPLDQLPDDFTKGIKLYYGLGIEKNEKECRKYFTRAFNSNKKKYKNALVFLALMDLKNDNINEAFEKLNNAWKLRSFYGLSKILILAMSFYEDPRFDKFANVLKDNEIADFLKMHANPHNDDHGQPDMQYVLTYAVFSCNKAELLHVTEAMAWHCLITLINNHKHIPALSLMAERSLFDDHKEQQNAALNAARVAHNFNLSIGHYYYGLAICSGLVQGKTFSEGIALIKQSRDESVSSAYHVLGDFALQGLDDHGDAVEIDYKKAFDYFQQGARVGDLISQYNLANMYFKGLGTEKDDARGEALLKNIFDKKAYCDVQLNIVKGLIYQHGVGTYQQDLHKAKDFYKKAGFSSEVARLIKNVDEEIEAQRIRVTAELLGQSEIAPTPGKGKKKSKAQAQAPYKTLEIESTAKEQGSSASLAQDIDIAGQKITDKLNAIPSSDGSIIKSCDTTHKIVTIFNPVDQSTVMIELEKMPAITDKMLDDLQKFTYQKRVRDWFSEKDRLLEQKMTLTDSIVRHTFPEKVDQIVQLYGKKYYFKTDKGTIKNYALFGKIIAADGTHYDGTFEYAFSDNSENVVYHRFLHPRSRIQQNYSKA